MATRFSAAPKSLDDLTALAARLSEPLPEPYRSQAAVDDPVALRKTEEDRAAPEQPPMKNPVQEAGNSMEAKPNETSSEPEGDDIIEFAERSLAAGAEEKEIRSTTARQKLTVIKLFVEITGKQTFQALKQTDIRTFVDCMALLPKVRGRSEADRALSVEALIARGRQLTKREVGLG